jgi:hypothetical protein
MAREIPISEGDDSTEMFPDTGCFQHFHDTPLSPEKKAVLRDGTRPPPKTLSDFAQQINR